MSLLSESSSGRMPSIITSTLSCSSASSASSTKPCRTADSAASATASRCGRGSLRAAPTALLSAKKKAVCILSCRTQPDVAAKSICKVWALSDSHSTCRPSGHVGSDRCDSLGWPGQLITSVLTVSGSMPRLDRPLKPAPSTSTLRCCMAATTPTSKERDRPSAVARLSTSWFRFLKSAGAHAPVKGTSTMDCIASPLRDSSDASDSSDENMDGGVWSGS
mmetsp:Transcript_14929/g.43883  ORF Transcript_14929/g.43883 Transcript_14929/m.43883 type:complete len:220 (+) Transcript_14929:1213-1872(+)